MSAAVKKSSPAPEARCAAGIEYQLVRRSIKQMHLHVHRNGEVSVSAPLRARAAQAEAESAPLPDKAEALMQMQAICEGLFPLFADSVPQGLPEICMRDMVSRWGVCNLRRRRITFALRLVQKPLAAQEYVAVHELCHLLVPNHSPLFWAEVEKRMPDWKARRALLRSDI